MENLSHPIRRRLVFSAPFLVIVAMFSILIAASIEYVPMKAYAQAVHPFKLKFSVSGPTLSSGSDITISGNVQGSTNGRIQFLNPVGVMTNPSQTLENMTIVQSGTNSITITAAYTDTDGDFAHFKPLKLYFSSGLPNLASSSTTFPITLNLATTPTSFAKATEEVADCDTDDPCPPSVAGQETALLSLTVTSPTSPTLEIDQ